MHSRIVVTLIVSAVVLGVACLNSQADDAPKSKLHTNVDVAFGKMKYSFTQAEAAEGIKIEYDIVVKEQTPGIVPLCQDDGNCSTPGPSGLIRFERLYGDGQLYGLFDVGLCPPEVSKPKTIKKGEYRHIFLWEGRNWRGPSDTCVPMGDPFPPGEYLFEVSFKGHDLGAKEAFFIKKTVKVQITK